ncbi:hypothetical protein N7493_002863 [Penicillium malachiteum]|uniref:Major facilitator superfamily (MFS) profile domain-containing protein n=1 Tax=Penicillium malachiteum TaxID=1324776 RepID=A0AAD6HSM7_9EURO|nr:hypothetical protein N7493_002863 [Penicillium malachiteum]
MQLVAQVELGLNFAFKFPNNQPSTTTWTTESTSSTSDKADQTYNAKAQVLNRAIQEIGMGRYQWQLFVVIGFGWASDNLWPIVTSLILAPVAYEFHIGKESLLTLAQNIDLLIVTAVFALVAAASPNFAAICVFSALWSIGVGGNLLVDSAIFLEFLPGSHQYLLTVLSIDWALAQVLANLIAWPLLGDMTCSSADGCTKAKNMGWRYYMITMGGLGMLMFVVRFVFFTIYDSPKYLMGKGQNEQAVKVVHEVARRNGKTSTLSQDDGGT